MSVAHERQNAQHEARDRLAARPGAYPRAGPRSLGGARYGLSIMSATPPGAGDDQLVAADRTARTPSRVLVLRLELLAALAGDRDRHGDSPESDWPVDGRAHDPGSSLFGAAGRLKNKVRCRAIERPPREKFRPPRRGSRTTPDQARSRVRPEGGRARPGPSSPSPSPSPSRTDSTQCGQVVGSISSLGRLPRVPAPEDASERRRPTIQRTSEITNMTPTVAAIQKTERSAMRRRRADGPADPADEHRGAPRRRRPPRYA